MLKTVTLLAFRPLAETDLPQLARWLPPDHVQEWWRDPFAPTHVREKYMPRIRGEEPTEVFVIVLDDADIGMIQRYRLSGYPAWSETGSTQRSGEHVL